MKILFTIKNHFILSTSLLGLVGSALSGSLVYAASSNTTNQAAQTATQQQHLANIQSKGAAEIDRRITSLNNVATKISSDTKLNSSDQAYLSSEVTTEINGLTALKTKLAGETTLSAAITDSQSIYNDYRVYALILPKIALVKVADDQQVTEGKLTTLSQQLQTRLTAEQKAGKNVTALQTELNDMTTQNNNAQSISSSIEQKVLTLQPSDYNSDHTILSGDAAQLKTAHGDILAAYSDAKSIVSGLKSL